MALHSGLYSIVEWLAFMQMPKPKPNIGWEKGDGRGKKTKSRDLEFRSVPKICNKFIKKTFCAIWDIMSAKLKSAINYFC
jgi:hypothetical protein